MSFVYAALAVMAVWGGLEAVRPNHPNEDDEATAFGGEIVCALAIGVGVFLALQVGA